MLVFAIIFCLTGCLRYETTASVHKDGTVDFSVIYAVADLSEEYGDEYAPDTEGNEEKMEALEDLGWEVEDYEEKFSGTNYVGIKATLEGVDLEDLQDELTNPDLKAAGFDFSTFTLEEDDGVYYLEWDVSGNVSSAESQSIDMDSLEQYGGCMKFVLELPGKVIESNGEESSGGKEVEWNFFEMDEAIYAEFDLSVSNSFPMWIIFVIIGAVIVIAAIVVIVIVMKKKKGAAPTDPTTPAYAGVVPQAPAAPQQFAQPTGFPQTPAAPQQFAPQAPVAPQQAPVVPQQAPVVPQAPAAPVVPQQVPQQFVPQQAPVVPQQAPVVPQAPAAPAAPEAPAAPANNDTPANPTV